MENCLISNFFNKNVDLTGKMLIFRKETKLYSQKKSIKMKELVSWFQIPNSWGKCGRSKFP